MKLDRNENSMLEEMFDESSNEDLFYWGDLLLAELAYRDLLDEPLPTIPSLEESVRAMKDFDEDRVESLVEETFKLADTPPPFISIGDTPPGWKSDKPKDEGLDFVMMFILSMIVFSCSVLIWLLFKG